MQTIPFYKAEHELRQLPHASLRTLAHRGRLMRFRSQSQIITQGQRGHELYIVLDGKLEAYIHAYGRKERRLTLAVLQAGDIFGEISLDGSSRTASICAIQSTLCAMVHGDSVEQQLDQDPGLQMYLTQTANRRNRDNTLLMAKTIFNDIYTRMTELLLSLSTPINPKQHAITERLTHQDIANRLGCSREMVSRLLKDLEKGGYISRRPDHTLVLHPPLPVAW
jgi:CRP/FNR family transcriptional regulator, cyclic AMP receptor protein